MEQSKQQHLHSETQELSKVIEQNERDDISHLRQTSHPKAEQAWSKEQLAKDPLAEVLAESLVEEMTSGQQSDVERQEKMVIEELGGPFIETLEEQEFDFSDDPEGEEEETFTNAEQQKRVESLGRQ